jgi:hypothetical protein
MSQHDLNIANQGFPAFRSDLNNALVALGTNASGATEPSTTFAHQFWMDTAADPSILKVRNADNDAWITLGTFNQTADTFTPAGVTSDKIEEGNSKVEVVDTGTGYIVFEVDGAEVARFNPDQLVTKAGTASTPAISPTGDLNTGIFFPAADTIAFAEGGAEAMRIDSDGDVGIGTTSPASRLHVLTGANTGITFQNTSGAGIKQYTDSTPANADFITNYYGGSGSETGTAYIIQQNGTERMRLDTGGNLRFNSGYGSVATAYGCRAWVNFNGTSTPAIREDGNVSSITDNGTGSYTVNFTNSMPDANYAAIAINDFYGVTVVDSYATGSVKVTTTNTGGSPVDCAFISSAIFR